MLAKFVLCIAVGYCCTITQCNSSLPSNTAGKVCARYLNGVLTYDMAIKDFYNSCSDFEYCPIDNFKNYAKNGDFVSCQPKKLWQMACNYDYECVSNACFANGTCGDYWLINEEQCTSSYDCNHQYYFCDLNMEFRAKPTCVPKVGNNVNCTYFNATDPFVDLCHTNLGKCLNSACTRYFTQPALTNVLAAGPFGFLLCQSGFINQAGLCQNYSNLPILNVDSGKKFKNCTLNANLCTYTVPNSAVPEIHPERCHCADDDIFGSSYCDFGGGEKFFIETMQVVWM